MSEHIYGRQPLLEALKNQRSFNKIFIAKEAHGDIIKTIFRLAREQKIIVQFVDKKQLDKIVAAANHQGAVGMVSPVAYADFKEIVEKLKNRTEAVVVILDRIMDPHNLGAILRSAHLLGADAVVIPKRHASGITETVVKVSAGAAEYIPVAQVTNLVEAIEKLKANGFWIAAAVQNGTPCYHLDLRGKVAVVLGSEGYGIQKLILQRTDYLISIPQEGKIDSLNVSSAAGILLYEIRRQKIKK